MTYRVVFSPEALAQLEALFRYIAQAAGPVVADRYTNAIVTYCEGLHVFPLRGMRRNNWGQIPIIFAGRGCLCRSGVLAAKGGGGGEGLVFLLAYPLHAPESLPFAILSGIPPMAVSRPTIQDTPNPWAFSFLGGDMPTAILIDGAYFIKRFRAIEPHNAHNAERAADCIFRWAVAHLSASGSSNGGTPRRQNRRELYRIFFYDCPPLEKKLHNPVSKRAVDFAKSDEAVFRLSLHQRLLSKRKLALRLGHLSTDTPWTIKPRVIADLLSGKTTMAALGSDDVMPAVRQKGVDMRIGVDVASLAFKKQVDQIVLIAGDADFVPAAKLARREGIDFVLDPMWRSIPQSLMEHIDGLRSTCPKPQR